MENCWKGIKETFTTSCHEILGEKEYYHIEWITNDTLKKVMERKDTKAKINSSRTKAEKTKAQKEYLEANKITKQRQEMPVKDKTGKKLEGEDEQRRRWKKHF